MRQPLMVLAVVLSAACARGDEAASADPDVSTGGSGPPPGFMARVDSNPERTPGNIAEARYTRSGDRWEVRTGPHHILWTPADTASGNYTVTARLEQMEAPAHREAFGIFVGGSNLDQSSQRYLYFVVGGTGEYMISQREGGTVRALKPWTADGSVPKADSSGKADYTLAIRVADDSVRFLVNTAQVAALPKAGLQTDGVAGIRIGHNLHLTVEPVRITR